MIPSGDGERKILLVTQQMYSLERQSYLLEMLSFIKTKAWKNIDDSQEFDLYIFDGFAP